MYTVFENIEKIAKTRPDLTVRLIYYEDQEELEDDIEIQVPLSTVAKELRPLMSLHWRGSESYYAGRDAELQRLLDLGPEGKALHNVWKAGETIEEILLHLANVTLSVLATDLSARRDFKIVNRNYLGEV